MSYSTTASVAMHSLSALDVSMRNNGTKPSPQPTQAIGSQTATVTLSTPANDPILPKISDANAERLAAVRQVVPLEVIHFGTSDDSAQQASQTRADDVVTATRAPQHGPDIDMKKVQAETDRKVREKATKKVEHTGSGMKIDNESQEILLYISEDFVLYTKAGSVVAYHAESGDELTKDGLKHYCAKHYGDILLIGQDKDGNQTRTRTSAGDIWWVWDHPLRRVVRRIVMEPTSLPINDDNPEVFNRWHRLKETMAEPNVAATTDDIGILLRHLLYISDNDTVGVAYFLNWLAWMYLHPDDKIPTAVLFYSKMGRVGKSILHRLLRQVFGPGMVGTCTGAAINKQFDDVVEHKRIVFINEMARSDKVDGYERFKNMISEDIVSFEGKGRAAKEIRNIAHYIITTNHEDALPLMEKDGRILVLRCIADRQPDAYYKALVEWIDGPGPAALAGVLLKWTFPKDWDAFAPVPQTASTLLMQKQSRGGLANFLEELMAAGKPPFDRDGGRCTALIEQLCSEYPNNTKSLHINNRTLPTALQQIGAQKVGSGTASSDNGWCWRRIDFWSAQPVKAWAAYLSGGVAPDHPHLSIVQPAQGEDLK
ncbi:primase-helicase family protein [Pseudomonas fluorescens]|uniref:primase-helicase family protein n=1 Tax=Pseudomonas fluorescens TaxID=294 RepID=UPI003C2CB109